MLSLDRVRELLGPEAEGLSDDEIADRRDRARIIAREYIASRLRPARVHGDEDVTAATDAASFRRSA